MKVIDKRTQVPGSLKHNKDDLLKYVGHFKDSKSGKIDYKDMIEDLISFDYRRAMANEG